MSDEPIDCGKMSDLVDKCPTCGGYHVGDCRSPAACPKCGATTDSEAAVMCKPYSNVPGGGEDCPMENQQFAQPAAPSPEVGGAPRTMNMKESEWAEDELWISKADYDKLARENAALRAQLREVEQERDALQKELTARTRLLSETCSDKNAG